MKPGITLKPRTPLAAIEPYLDRVFLALVMTVEPGFGGQVFMEDQIAKIDRLWELRKERNFDYLIEVDGGITDETITCARRADAFVAGNFVFKQDYRTAIDGLRRQATGS
jgi:ribulose-phosphate 3-epimerase